MTGKSASKPSHKDISVSKDEKSTAVVARKATRMETLKRLLRFASDDLLRTFIGVSALVVNSLTNLSFPWILGLALDNFKCGAGNLEFLLGSVSVFAVGSVASWVRVYCLGTATDSIANKLRNALFNAYMDKNIDFFNANRNGELLTILDKDVQEASEVLTEKLSAGLRSLNSSVNGSVMLYLTSPKLCAVSLSVVPFVGVGAMMLAKYSRVLTEKLRGINSESTSYALERFSSFSTIRLNNRQQYEKGKFSCFSKSLQSTSRQRHFAYGSFMSFINMATNVSMIAVLRVGGDMMAKGQITAGELTRFAIQSGFVGLGFSGLSTFYADLKRGLDAAARVFEVLDAPAGGEETPAPSAPATPIVTSVPFARGSSSTDDRVEFRGVCFSYRSRPDCPVLANFSVDILPNQITAFVGKSGAGKTSILNLLSGLYVPTAGYIRCCDRVVSCSEASSEAPGCDRNWCTANVGVVEQSSSPLLSGTIAENIEYGKLGASQEDIEAAARAAAAHDFITALPKGYQTEVGVGGSLLSGGQRARIAIARALVKNPSVLLLDEATAALDSENEAEIALILQKLAATKTVVVVTHSEALRKIAHTVYTIEKGAIVKN